MKLKEKVIEIHRNELYKQVWKLPVSRLAPKYGISDVGLSKICRKLKVPKPPRGYWTKIQFGKKVRQTPLPELKNDDMSTYTVRIKPLFGTIPKLNSEFNELVIAESKSEKRITVPRNLKSPHLLVKETRKNLEKKKPGDHGVLHSWREKSLSISVSPECLNRALRIMDTIIKEFESKGFTVSVDAGETSRLPSTYVEILGEKVHFSINEKVKRTDHIPTKEETERQKKYSWATPQRWNYVPTGKLSLKIEVWGACGKRKKWSDSQNKRLEYKLSDFFVGVIFIAGVLRQERLESEEEQRKWEEEQKRKEEVEKRRKAEEERFRDLENQALLWAKSKHLRTYIQAVEKAVSTQKGSEEFQKRIEKWLSWAKEYADRLDPLKKGLPFNDDTSDSGC